MSLLTNVTPNPFVPPRAGGPTGGQPIVSDASFEFTIPQTTLTADGLDSIFSVPHLCNVTLVNGGSGTVTLSLYDENNFPHVYTINGGAPFTASACVVKRITLTGVGQVIAGYLTWPERVDASSVQITSAVTVQGSVGRTWTLNNTDKPLPVGSGAVGFAQDGAGNLQHVPVVAGGSTPLYSVPVKQDASGNIGTIQNAPAAYVFGDGSDGDVVFDGSTAYAFATLSGGNYTLTRDVQATSITVDSAVSVFPAGYALRATDDISVVGRVNANGEGGAGGAGGGANTGGGAGSNAATLATCGYVGGGGGGGGGGSAAGGTGGNGGAGGGVSALFSPTIVLYGAVTADGVGGGAGASYGGGGGGGGGGVVLLVYQAALRAVSGTNYSATAGGAGGAGPTIPTTANTGDGGGAGGTGIIGAGSIYNPAAGGAGGAQYTAGGAGVTGNGCGGSAGGGGGGAAYIGTTGHAAAAGGAGGAGVTITIQVA